MSVDRKFYRQSANVDRDLNEPVDDWQDWLDTRETQVENYITHPTNLDNVKFDEFPNVKARVDKFRLNCFTVKKGSKDSFCNAVLQTLVFKIFLKKILSKIKMRPKK